MEKVYVVPYDEYNYANALLVFNDWGNAQAFCHFVSLVDGKDSFVKESKVINNIAFFARIDRGLPHKKIEWLWRPERSMKDFPCISEDGYFVEIGIKTISDIDSMEKDVWRQYYRFCEDELLRKEQEA